MKYSSTIQDAIDIAEKKTAIPGWKGYAWESISGGSIVTGAVPSGVFMSGPRKGKPRFTSPNATRQQKVLVSDDELQMTASQYETNTGKCWNCKGTGKEWSGWSAAEGAKYRTCYRCGGDGKKPITGKTSCNGWM